MIENSWFATSVPNACSIESFTFLDTTTLEKKISVNCGTDKTAAECRTIIVPTNKARLVGDTTWPEF